VFGKRSTPANGHPSPSEAAATTRLEPAQPAPATSPRPESAPASAAVVEGGRAPIPSAGLGAPLVTAPTPGKRTPGVANAPSPPLAPSATDSRHSDAYYETKAKIFGALIEAIDLAQLAKLDADSSREEIRDIINEIIAIKAIVMSISEQEELLDDICNDVLGYGPLEPLLARDDIADIMVNGSGTTYIEVKGKIQKTGIRFRDNQQLLNIASASSARSAVAWMNRRPSATPACRTDRASTLSFRRWHSTVRRLPSANSRRTSSPSSNW
jgi:pilus assembly protein CpaF